MRISRKTKNRKLNRKSVLEVKARSREAHWARLRLIFVSAFSLVGAAALIISVWQGGRLILNRAFYENDTFNIKEVVVETDGFLSPQQICQLANIKSGDNLLALNWALVKRDLELVQWIKSVSIEKILPNRLKLKIDERAPIAQAHTYFSNGKVGEYSLENYLIDDTACVISASLSNQVPAALRRSWQALPVISGIPNSALAPGRKIQAPEVGSALRWIKEFEQSDMYGEVQISRIIVFSDDKDFLKVTTAQGSRITFANQHWQDQFRKWRIVHERGRLDGRVIATLDLSISNYNPVCWKADNLPTRYRTQGANLLNSWSKNV
jgi:hypothetical protein